MAPVLKSLLLGGLLAVAEASPKVLPMKFQKDKRNAAALQKRNTVSVDVGNAHKNGLYFVNATIGTPPQTVNLQIDTGSSDVWMFGPGSCDTQSSQCLGGAFDGSKSSSAALIAEGKFKIQYQTPGSGVQGDYFSDDFGLGGATIKNLTMAVASQAVHVPTGIMGIGFNTNEAFVAQGGEPYPNIVDEMVNQGLISSRAYSLYLDDLEDVSGTILFGGYDKAKYKGDLVTLPIQADARSGEKNTMSVAWTSLSITDPTGTTFITPSDHVAPVVLDTGATYTLLPPDLFQTMATYFTAINDDDYGWLVPCNISSQPGQVDYGFGGPFFSVAFDQLAIPLTDDNDKPLTFKDNSPACKFGIAPVQEGGLLLFGDTFLRSQYVVYDLDHQEISIAPTKFNVTDSQVVEISNSTRAQAVSTVQPPAASQTATALEEPGLGTSTGAASGAQFTQTGPASFGQISGPKTTVAAIAPVGTAKPASSKGAGAHVHGAPFIGAALFDVEALLLMGVTGAMMMVGGAFMAVF